MQEEFNSKINETVIKKIIEGSYMDKKPRLASTIFYLFKPSLYPILISTIIFSIFLFVAIINNTSFKTVDNKESSIDSLNTFYLKNSIPFSNSIEDLSKKINFYITQPFDSFVYGDLKNRGIVLLQNDSLSLEQKKFIITKLNLLDEWKH